ncbi:MAG TPA: MGMT family protein [bacterium]|nr:MGMT family protein [bacterium]HPQ65833.1 MGMT family protein [bacterium]
MGLKVISSPIGEVKVAEGNGGVRRLELPERPPAEPVLLPPGAPRDWRRLLGAGPADTAGSSEFRRRVWAAAAAIPFGQTRSYGWVASKAGKPRAARAVGGALHANPVPLLVPCHRVIRADGELGGFGRGRAWKIFLLRFEADNREKP